MWPLRLWTLTVIFLLDYQQTVSWRVRALLQVYESMEIPEECDKLMEQATHSMYESDV